MAKKLNFFGQNIAIFFEKIKKNVMRYALLNFIFHMCEKFGTNMHWMQLSTKIQYHNTLATLTHVYQLIN